MPKVRSFRLRLCPYNDRFCTTGCMVFSDTAMVAVQKTNASGEKYVEQQNCSCVGHCRRLAFEDHLMTSIPRKS